VLWEILRLAPTCRALNPNPHFNRRISLIFLMVSLLCVIFASSLFCDEVKLDTFLGS
jgi:hypothetical protein